MQLPPLKCNLSQKFHTKGKWTTKNAKNVYFSSFAILKSATYKVLSRNEPWIYLTSLNWKFFFWSSLETVPLHLIHLPLLVEAWFQGSAERKTSYLAISFVLIFSFLTSPNRMFFFLASLQILFCGISVSHELWRIGLGWLSKYLKRSKEDCWIVRRIHKVEYGMVHTLTKLCLFTTNKIQNSIS